MGLLFWLVAVEQNQFDFWLLVHLVSDQVAFTCFPVGLAREETVEVGENLSRPVAVLDDENPVLPQHFVRLVLQLFEGVVELEHELELVVLCQAVGAPVSHDELYVLVGEPPLGFCHVGRTGLSEQVFDPDQSEFGVVGQETCVEPASVTQYVVCGVAHD